MAIRTKSEFETLYGTSGTVFPDNTTGEISESDVRAFGQDIADSVFGGGASISDAALDTSWNGSSSTAPSKNAVYDAIGGLYTIVFEIGDWDIDFVQLGGISAATLSSAGVDPLKIRSVSAVIRNDADTVRYPFPVYNPSTDAFAGYISGFNGTLGIILTAINGGFLDSTDFDSTSYNRGWVTIQYEA